MRIKRLAAALAGAALVLAAPAYAVTEIQWWHAMTGRLGDQVNLIANDFNASQSDYKVVPIYKGGYADTMAAGIAAYRAGNAPDILQVYEVGTATMMAAKGAVLPIYKLMERTGDKLDMSDYMPAVVSYYSDPHGNLISMPFNSSTPVLFYNKDAFKKAGLDPNKPPKTCVGISSKLSGQWIFLCGLYRLHKSSWFNCPGSLYKIFYQSQFGRSIESNSNLDYCRAI